MSTTERGATRECRRGLLGGLITLVGQFILAHGSDMDMSSLGHIAQAFIYMMPTGQFIRMSTSNAV